MGDSDKTVSVLLGAKSSGSFSSVEEKKLFTPIPQNVFEQKEWNLQLIEARILSSCLLLLPPTQSVSLRLAKESFFTFFLFLLAHSQFYCVLPLFHR